MGTPHKYAEVIKAWADGKTIQWRRNWGLNPTQWQDIEKPDFHCETVVFRVKPEKKSPGLVYMENAYPVRGRYGVTFKESDVNSQAQEGARAVIEAYKRGELDYD